MHVFGIAEEVVNVLEVALVITSKWTAPVQLLLNGTNPLDM